MRTYLGRDEDVELVAGFRWERVLSVDDECGELPVGVMLEEGAGQHSGMGEVVARNDRARVHTPETSVLPFMMVSGVDCAT